MHLIHPRRFDIPTLVRFLNSEKVSLNSYTWIVPRKRLDCFENPFYLTTTKTSKNLSVKLPSHLRASDLIFLNMYMKYHQQEEGLCFETEDWVY